ncbi:unnamed protein product, partial [Ceratitis capitata]
VFTSNNINQRKFTIKQNYIGLEEAVEFIIGEEIEGNEDDLVSSNFPSDIPGTLEVVSRHSDYQTGMIRDDEALQLPNTNQT